MYSVRLGLIGYELGERNLGGGFRFGALVLRSGARLLAGSFWLGASNCFLFLFGEIACLKVSRHAWEFDL